MSSTSVSEPRHDTVASRGQQSPAGAGSATDAGNTRDGDSSSKKTLTPKPPPPEKAEDIQRRSYIVASFWFVVLFFGLPIWWKTTTIYRADLPLSQMMDWADGRACNPVFPIRIAIDAPTLRNEETENLVRITQQALDTPTDDFKGHHLQLEVSEPATANRARDLARNSNVALTIRLSPGDVATSSFDSQLPILDVAYPPNSIPAPNAASSGLATYLAAQLRDAFSEERDVMSYLLSTSSMPFEQRPPGSSQDLSDSLSKRMTRSVKYSRTYHLTFSLFTSGPIPSSWDIESAIDEYMKPILDMLGPIHNFTIDTQVQLYANPGVQSQMLSKEDLSSFINAAEWPLSPSIGGAPTVNFVVYIGNQTIGTASETGTSQSWLIPQWGSVYLLPPPSADHVSSEILKQPILTFTSHLLSLIGTPQSGPLPMRLSTLTRIRTADLLLRASSSLGSLARLSLALPSISIPSSVADGVAKSMHHLQLACSNLGGTSGLENARIADVEAERAFFEKSMVGQLYFPDEHKIAVYLPLLGPVGVPLVIGLLNQIKAWKKARKEKIKET
ncbi:phosphatidylinositol-glycan biosynthesis class S protein [Annulohypoxylon maeteangense]|uniref:phosphatidylinositol-glycan biosynthesis class S protein n=1 Tax=Annulohypoxylon maeteangense TaxID=1927788 RepID=UPI002008D167|nr:phosphatidylinositol-glycan biosynthesis class S protein [Annulohypoxylon maeteangense]KAI0881365.1 phosphatidylinositol-glycan biosynthesis class S protein [Annulohypoxylon maeteangense]